MSSTSPEQPDPEERGGGADRPEQRGPESLREDDAGREPRALTPADEAKLKRLDAVREILFEEEQRQLAELSERLASEQQKIEELTHRVTEAEEHAVDVSRVLPEAIELRAAADTKLGEALSPTIEEAIDVSVQKNPKALADAIFPIIGPAIRKSVQAMLAGMVQRLNRALEESLSVKSLRWRLEARRTGRSFAEIVLLHSLVYRVEQVFLIHKETGLLLAHVVAPAVQSQDADVVSGMLSAIRDFVHDSFESPAGDELQTLRVGDLNIAVEQGPQATVAAIVRGTPPVRFRGRLQEVLEDVHTRQAQALKEFDGDVSVFGVTEESLSSLLLEQRRQRAGSSFSPALRLAATGALLIGIVFAVSWWVTGLERRKQLSELVEALRSEPGVVVLAAERADGRVRVEGLRDPDARDPRSVLSTTRIDPERVDFTWTEFASLEPGPVLARVTRVLEPPRTVSVRLENGVLRLRGRAGRRWIERAVQIAAATPGVLRVDASELGDPSVARLMECRRYLEVLRVHYESGSLVPSDDDMNRLRHAVLKLDEAAREADFQVGVNVRAAGPLGPQRTRALADGFAELPLTRTVVNPTARVYAARTEAGGGAGGDEIGSAFVSFSVALFDGGVAAEGEDANGDSNR